MTSTRARTVLEALGFEFPPQRQWRPRLEAMAYPCKLSVYEFLRYQPRCGVRVAREIRELVGLPAPVMKRRHVCKCGTCGRRFPTMA